MVAIGWGKTGSLKTVTTRESVTDLLRKYFPEYTKVQLIVNTGQVFRFRNDLVQGSDVLTYDPNTRLYHFGNVSGDYKYKGELNEELEHTRPVTWIRTIPRDELSPATKNSLGSIATIFRVSDNAAEEIRNHGNNQAALATGDDTNQQVEISVAPVAEAELRKDTEQRALEFLQDKLNQLDWMQMQELVAGLLRAMGYKTRISPAGADRGRDIIASPDGFGFQQPRILVEVKHRTGAMGAPALRSFTGGLRQGDNGLYVSTGGFSREARYEADRSNHPLTLMDSADLGNAIIEHYDRMDLDTRTLLPLKKIYWPV